MIDLDLSAASFSHLLEEAGPRYEKVVPDRRWKFLQMGRNARLMKRKTTCSVLGWMCSEVCAESSR